MSRKGIIKSEFIKSVATVMTGTALSQIIAIMVTPILTRNYSPDDFGVLMVYISAFSIIGTISSGKFEQVILLVKEWSVVRTLIYLSILISVIVAFLTAAVLFVAQNNLIVLLEISHESYQWFFTLPLLIILYTLYTVFNVVLNYQGSFKRLASGKVVKTLASVIISLSCIFFLNDARGLILGEISGYLLGSIYVTFTNRKLLSFNKQVRKNSLEIAKRYKDFPLYTIPSDFLNMMSSQMPAFFLTTYFGTKITGFYSLMKRVIEAPVNLFSKSVLEVFRQKAAQQFTQNGECKKLFKKTAKSLFVVAILPFTALMLFSPQLFAFVFGSEWLVAGEYARIFAVYYFFKFISSPLSYMFYIAEKQKEDFLLHLYIFCSSLLILNLPKFLPINDVQTLWIYCVNFTIVYISYFVISLKLASGRISMIK